MPSSGSAAASKSLRLVVGPATTLPVGSSSRKLPKPLEALRRSKKNRSPLLAWKRWNAVALRGANEPGIGVAPGVTSKSPAPGAKRVKRDKNVVAGFSEEVQGVNKATLKLTNQKSGNKVKAKITKLSGNRWRLDPKTNLKRNTDYRVRLIGTSSGIRDLAGNPLANTGWKFHTR